MFVLITPCVHNNGFRGIIIGIIVLAIGLYIATDLAPLITTAAANVQFDMGGAAQISSICDGANPLSWASLALASPVSSPSSWPSGTASASSRRLLSSTRLRLLRRAPTRHSLPML